MKYLKNNSLIYIFLSNLIKKSRKINNSYLKLLKSNRYLKVAFIVGETPSLSGTFILNQITGILDLGHDIEICANKKSSTKNTSGF